MEINSIEGDSMGMQTCKKIIFCMVILYFFSSSYAYGGFFDTVTDSLSKAGEAISDTAGEVVDSAADTAKKVGEDIGLVEKEEPPARKKTHPKQPQKQQQKEKTALVDTSEAACKQWSEDLQPYMGGEKGLQAYPTEDETLIKKWRTLYAEARTTVNNYPDGTCNRADSVAEYIQKKLDEFTQIDSSFKTQVAQAKLDQGGFYFSKNPISDPENVAVADAFNAGDNIYGIITMKKSWKQVYSKDKGFSIRIDVKIDGKKIHAQFVTIRSKEYSARDYLVFNVAPAISELRAYSNPNIEYGKSSASTVQGPNELTHHLGGLSPGKHNFEFSLYWYGKIWAKGGFTVSGDSFAHYKTLHQQIAGGIDSSRTLPAAKMHNEEIEKEMIALLKNAGWDNVYRLNIVDKDWWIERVNGGNTAVKSRYMAAAALTDKKDGTYQYCTCTFTQDKLLSGGFGKLYLSHQGEGVLVSRDNIDK